MKKNILALITLLCLSSPLHAEYVDKPCMFLDVPCYIKPDKSAVKAGTNVIVLRASPHMGAEIVEEASPPKGEGKLYFYLRKIVVSEEKEWGYFDPENSASFIPTPLNRFPENPNKRLRGGWAPLYNAFHSVDEIPVRQIQGENYLEFVQQYRYRPNGIVFLISMGKFEFIVPMNERQLTTNAERSARFWALQEEKEIKKYDKWELK